MMTYYVVSTPLQHASVNTRYESKAEAVAAYSKEPVASLSIVVETFIQSKVTIKELDGTIKEHTTDG